MGSFLKTLINIMPTGCAGGWQDKKLYSICDLSNNWQLTRCTISYNLSEYFYWKITAKCVTITLMVDKSIHKSNKKLATTSVIPALFLSQKQSSKLLCAVKLKGVLEYWTYFPFKKLLSKLGVKPMLVCCYQILIYLNFGVRVFLGKACTNNNIVNLDEESISRRKF